MLGGANSMGHMAGALGIFFIVAIGAILLLWIIFPFSLFGLKDQVKKLSEEQKETNALLSSIMNELKRNKPGNNKRPDNNRDA